MPITRNFTLYLNAGISVAPTVHVNQYDRGEQWVFTLLDDKGQKYTPSSGALIGVKADGNAIAGVTGTVGSNGDVYITETQQMTAAAGKAIFELTIDGQTHGTANFIVQVEKKPTDDAVISESDLSIIQQGIDSVTPAAINETVSEYLAEHMTNPPIDPTLTVSNAAADAKVTGDKVTDLKNALGTTTRNIANAKYGRYSANNNTGVITQNASNQNIFGMSDKVPCQPNTQYAVSIYTPDNPDVTIYAFYYSESAFLSKETLLATKNGVITTPSDASYIYVYCYRSNLSIDETSVIKIEKGYTVTEKISGFTANDIVARQGETIDIPYTEHKGYFSATGGISNPSTSNEYYTDKIDVSLFRSIGASVKYTESRALWLAYCTYDENGDFIERPVLKSADVDGFGNIVSLGENVKYIAFTYRKFTDGVFKIFGTLSDAGVLDRIIDDKVTASGNIGEFPLRFKPVYDHLFVNTSPPYITIPHESLYHVRLSRRLGFNVIEANIASTSDGIYMVNHLESGKFGKYFHHVDGTTDISNIAPSSVTWDWIVQNVRYNSSITKYQTRPCRLEEFLSECRQQNIIPFIYSSDVNVLKMADEYMGKDNFIAYGASREKCPNGIIYHWVTKTTKADIIEYCETIGKPFIYGMSNPTAFTDTELKDIVNTLHENGYWIGVSYADSDWYKYSAMGIDANGTQKYINRMENGNICNFDTTFGFDDFTYTNATESDGVLTFTAEGFIEPNISADNLTLGAVDIEVWFNGTITVYGIGEQQLDLTYTSDGTYPFFMATPIINKTPKFRIKATNGTVIKDIKFKATKV